MYNFSKLFNNSFFLFGIYVNLGIWDFLNTFFSSFDPKLFFFVFNLLTRPVICWTRIWYVSLSIIMSVNSCDLIYSIFVLSYSNFPRRFNFFLVSLVSYFIYLFFVDLVGCLYLFCVPVIIEWCVENGIGLFVFVW